MAQFNFLNEQVTTDAAGKAISTAPITSSQQTASGVLTNVQTGTPKPITTSQLQPTTALQVPTQQPDISQADSSVSGTTQANKSLLDYIAQFTAPQTAEQKQT